ncbi:MAG TPA: hypothetical protein PKY96_06720 [Flavobacteriales bacterium]|nr:hypothetical protein [Flavobacteriales bacterium]
MVAEASFTGTVRIIIILLALLWVVRVIARRAAARKDPHQGARPKGDVRIERTPGSPSGNGPHGTIIDADYEEIK